MKKLIGLAAVGLALAAAGFTGVAYWSGQQAERWYRDALTEGSKNPNVQLATLSYRRGLFASRAVTRVQFALPESSDLQEADPSFLIRQDIYHGPLPLAGWGVPRVPMQWTGAVVRATLDPDSGASWTRKLAKLYGGQEPIVAISQIAFDGASDTWIAMPPLTLSNVENVQSLKFPGLQGQFRVAPRGGAVQGELSVASLELTGKPTAGDGQSAGGGGLIKLRDLAMTVNQRKGAFDLLFGQSRFRISELSVQDQATGAPFVMTGLSVTGSLSQQNPQQVAGEVVLNLDKVTVDQQSGAGGLKLALRNVDGAAVARLQDWQQRMASKPDDPQALGELLELVKALLRGKPEFVLDSQVTLALGEWRGKLTLNFQDSDAIDPLKAPASLLGALEKGLADVAASKTLVEALLTNTVKEQLMAQATEQGKPASESAVQSLAAQQVAQQLQGLTAAGFIRLEGEQYKSTARFEAGRLFVNNQEIPLAAAGSGGAAGN